MDKKWVEMRRQFRVCDNWIYLNHAAVSPLPLLCSQRMAGYLDELSGHGAANYPRVVIDALGDVRQAGARLLGARPDQIFVVRSTTQGLGIAATGLPLTAGDNLVLVEREFPANLRPWMPLRRRGVEIRMVPQREGRVLVDDLRSQIDRNTRLVSVSFVQFFSGFRIDLAAVAEVCRSVDALLVVDAIQGAGAFGIDVQSDGVDFLSADAHKWLLGPEGVGLGFVSDRALDLIQPALEGWLSVENPFDFFDLEQPLKDNAARFEEGAYNTAGLCGLGGSLEMLLEAEVDAISARILELSDRLVAGLDERGWLVLSPRDHESEKSGIVTAVQDGRDMDELERELRGDGIVISVRDGAVRVAPHAYNTEEEIDALLEHL